MKFLNCVSLIATVFFPIICFAQSNDGEKEAASLLTHYIGNLEAIESFDVLIDMDRQWVGLNGALEGYTSKERLIVDPQGKRCCSVRKLTRTRYLPSKNGATEEKDEALRVVVSNGSKAWGRDFPQPAFPINAADLRTVLRTNDTVHVQSIGIIAFPLRYAEIENFRQHVEYLRFGKLKLKLASGLQGNPAIRMFLPYTENVAEEKVIALDRDSLAPRKMSKTFVNQNLRTRQVQESYAFTERNGIILPSTITGEKRTRKMIVDKAIVGTDIYDVKLHWRSINEDLDRERFMQQFVLDANKALSLLSLEATEE